jgi:hypothetical protein
VTDIKGAGNSFLGGLAAGLSLTIGNIHEGTVLVAIMTSVWILSLRHITSIAVLYTTVSASFVIEQAGLPSIDSEEDSAVEKNGM